MEDGVSLKGFYIISCERANYNSLVIKSWKNVYGACYWSSKRYATAFPLFPAQVSQYITSWPALQAACVPAP